MHFIGLFLSSLLKMHGPKNKIGFFRLKILLSYALNLEFKNWTEVTYSFYSWRDQDSVLSKNYAIALYEKRSHGVLDLIFACQGQKKKQKRVLRVSGTLQTGRTKV